MNAYYCKLKKGYCGAARMDEHHQIYCGARHCPMRGDNECLTPKGRNAEKSDEK